jgi:hypothetical protein
LKLVASHVQPDGPFKTHPAERPIMKRLAIALLVAAGLAAPAFAQNASQVAAAKAGKSCPGCNLFQIDLDWEDV